MAMCVYIILIFSIPVGLSITITVLLDQSVNTHTVLYSHKGMLIAKADGNLAFHG